jgi:hypothetical protein
MLQLLFWLNTKRAWAAPPGALIANAQYSLGTRFDS